MNAKQLFQKKLRGKQSYRLFLNCCLKIAKATTDIKLFKKSVSYVKDIVLSCSYFNLFKLALTDKLLITTCQQLLKLHFSIPKMLDCSILNRGGQLPQTKQLIDCGLDNKIITFLREMWQYTLNALFKVKLLMGMYKIEETCGKLPSLDILDYKKYPNEILDIR